MTLQQIKYLETIAQLGSISKAAEELYAAQSSLSAAVRDVEDEYSITIFERTSKGVVLTHQGREFLADISYISNYFQHVDSKYRHADRENERFCVSSHHNICGEGAFLRLTASMQDKHYQFGYLEGSTPFVVDNVDSLRSDIGILFFTESAKGVLLQDMRKRDMIFNHLSYGNMHIYVHTSHPLAARREVTLNDITQFPFVTYDNDNPESGRYTISFRQWNKSRQMFYVSDRASAYAIIRMGQAYATGSGHLSADERNSDIVSVPVVDLEKIEVGWVNKHKIAPSEVAIEFIELLKDLYSAGV